MTRARYLRPLVQTGMARPEEANVLAGGWGWFSHVEILTRDREPLVCPARDIDPTDLVPLVAKRTPLAGLTMERPQIMGIVNATPDSFSDGGKHAVLEDALAGANAMIAAGADLLDIGGESTRPGAETVAVEEEIRRIAPVIEGLRQARVPLSLDTRKAAVAQAGVTAGAGLINDVSGFTYDSDLAGVAVETGLPVCVMHALGDPATMQQNPIYDNVLLDVFDFLEQQINHLVAAGVQRSCILADPGIGFGKTLAHNLVLLERLSLFHALGVPILLGASRKRFIGTIGGAEVADQRVAGSVAVALAGFAQGVQMVRVHDVAETVQARALWWATMNGAHP